MIATTTTTTSFWTYPWRGAYSRVALHSLFAIHGIAIYNRFSRISMISMISMTSISTSTSGWCPPAPRSSKRLEPRVLAAAVTKQRQRHAAVWGRWGREGGVGGRGVWEGGRRMREGGA